MIPGSYYSAPYGYSPTGIAWRTDHIDSASILGSWNDLWQHPSANGKKYVLDQIEEGLGMALQKLGYPANSGDASQINAAADALIELKPQLAAFSTDDLNLLASGQAWLTQAWGGDVYWASQQVKDPNLVGFKVPKEGGLIGSDLMSIGAKAKHPGTALLFIDWLLDPAHSAKNVQYMGQMNGTSAGNAAWSKMMADYPLIGYPETVVDTATWKLAPSGERLLLMNQAWTKVKAS